MSWLQALGILPGPPRIAPVTTDAAERLAEIHAGAFARPWGPEDFEGFLLDRSTHLDALYLGRDRLPSGFALSRVALDEAEVLSVALASGARGYGHSRLLLDHHLRELARSGVRTVHLEVEDGNVPAISLYRRLGFVQVGTRPGYYLRPDGSRACAMSMSRALDGAAEPPRTG